MSTSRVMTNSRPLLAVLMGSGLVAIVLAGIATIPFP